MPAPPEISAAHATDDRPACTLAIDGHVHLTAELSFATIASNVAHSARGSLPLCLVVECHGIDRFAALSQQLEPWGELGLIDRQSGVRFIAGRQIVTSEGVEVLLHGSRDQSLEGKTAETVIAAGLEQGAVISLPWGFGKWLGSRRQVVQRLLGAYGQRILKADIVNRPSVWPEPIFAAGRVLRGSDNLPIRGGAERVGQFGSIITLERPDFAASDVLAALSDPLQPLLAFGKRKGVVSTFSEQLRLRMEAR